MPPSGGASGVVTVPTAMTLQQANLLFGTIDGVSELFEDSPSDAEIQTVWDAIAANNGMNIISELGEAVEHNPFTGVAQYDPEPDIAAAESAFDEWYSVVQDMEPEQLLASIITESKKHLDEELLDSTYIDTAVENFETRTQDTYLRSSSRAFSSLLSARAVMTGMFDNTVAYMENQRQAEVNDYDARLRLTFHEQRTHQALEVSRQMIGLVQLQLQSHQNIAQFRQQLAVFRITAKQDQINMDLKLDENEVLWNLELFRYPEMMIAAHVGGVPGMKPQSTGERLLTAVGQAGTMGVMAGTATGSMPLGLAVGGIAGVLGIAGAFFN